MILAILLAAQLAAPPPDASCAIALPLLPRRKAAQERVLYGDGAPSGWLTEVLARPDLELGWRGQAPEAATLEAFRKQPDLSALTCPALRQLAAREGEVADDASLIRRLDAERLKSPPIAAYRMSLPAIGPRGDEALVAVSAASNQLSVDGWLVFLRKDAQGHWREAGRKLLFVG